MEAESLKNILISELMESPVGTKITKAMETVALVNEHLCALMDPEEDTQLKLLRIGSVFQIFLINTLIPGRRKTKDLSREEWKEIFEKVSENAILADGQAYSEFVFSMYADYIDISANAISALSEKEKVDEIKELAVQLRDKTEALRAGTLREVDYVEDSMWVSLEAMVKLLSATASALIQRAAGSEYAQFTDAVFQIGFEYSRYVLYAKEQAILEEYIRNQHVLDDKLREEYEAYVEELRRSTDMFLNLVETAFEGDVRSRLQQSALLAEEAGVREEEILRTEEDIDAFFLD